MPDPAVIHADLELFLVDWYRAALAARSEPFCQGVVVTNREPTTVPARMLIIRDDGGTDTSLITAERSVGLSVLAGSKENPKEANDLARVVHALRTQIPSTDVDNPVAAVLTSNGPIPITEAQPRARRYITITVAVVGSPL